MSALAEQVQEQLRVRTAEEVPAAALARFYERMYPRRADFLQRHWRWLYRVGAYDSIPAPLVVVHDDEVIGHAGLIPVTLRRGGVERTAIWFVDFGVLPEYQRQGLGVGLTREWMAACPLHVTFCNERSLGVFLKYGWEARFHTYNFKLPLRPERHPGMRQGSASRRALAHSAGLAARIVWRTRTLSKQEPAVSPATAEHLRALSAGVSDTTLHATRSPEFLNWRVETHPRGQDYFVLRDERGGVYSMLARIVEEGGYRRLHLLALGGGTGDDSGRHALSNFFAGIVRWSLARDVHHVWFVTSDPAAARVARRWFPMCNRARFACHANDAAGAEFLSGTDHRWEGLDSDFDLAGDF
ncbi:MAG: GNAT family N-acetyltransferase [Pyrinomonadaceae bacterium]